MSDDLHGYYRSPTIHEDLIVFVCETDLWSVSTAGGLARRLTDHHVDTHSPFLSPDGAWVAYRGRDEGASEVYVMPSRGGRPQRLTYQCGLNTVVGWSAAGEHVLYASDAQQTFGGDQHLWSVARTGGPPQVLPTGPADRVSYGPNGGVVIGRNVGDPARWKRYRGGRAGELWVDPEGQGQFRPLVRLAGNLANPMWVGERIYFLSDHEGWGNIYSCTAFGEDLTRHTAHQDFYARNATTDGKRIVYQAGAALYLYDPRTGTSQGLDVEVASSKPQLTRRFVDAQRYVQRLDIHPHGHALAAVARGRMFSFGLWERAVTHHGDGDGDGVRYRLATHLEDGEHLVCLSDAGGEEALELHHLRPDAQQASPVRRFPDLDLGRPLSLIASPVGQRIALTNHRHELLTVDLEQGTLTVLDKSPYSRLQGVAFSPDGRHLAYGFSNSPRTSQLRLANVESGEVHELTPSDHDDGVPSFDPTGKYLYFISYRTFNPVHDQLYFDFSFPKAGKVYLITLQGDAHSPLDPPPKNLEGKAPAGPPPPPQPEPAPEPEPEPTPEPEPATVAAEPADDAGTAPAEATENTDPPPAPPPPPDKKDDPLTAAKKETRIDLEGISQRVLALPVPEGLYRNLEALQGKVLYDRWPIRSPLSSGVDAPSHHLGSLFCYDFDKQKEEMFVPALQQFKVGLDRKTLLYRQRNRVRVVKAEAKPPGDNGEGYTRASGFIDLSRLRVSVLPQAEWQQMYREAWRLQRDNFWNPTMSGVDWQDIYQRYLPVLKRVATRTEFSDLMWEVQGELGTSHAYEYGGDHPRAAPGYGRVGFLGADLELKDGQWIIQRILQGDCWQPDQASPLSAPGLNLQAGDKLLQIQQQPLGPEVTPSELLTNLTHTDVDLVVQRDDEPPRTVTIKTLRNERRLRYRDWVQRKRDLVHAQSQGRLGYVHIPDMGANGYAEFHRQYLAEVHRDGLVVDVRYNGGGNVSALILSKLARKRIAYQVPRNGQPQPYPRDSILGPLVCVTNEHAGSDGDIFSHSFKLLKLGPLVGQRTWGGVVGIWPRHPLVDHTITTQAEFAFWFSDVGFGVENHGTDPDVVVEITPQDWLANRDPQLERAITLAMEGLAQSPPEVPDFSTQLPNLRPPRLD